MKTISNLFSDLRGEELWRVEGFLIYDDRTFVYVNGAHALFPAWNPRPFLRDYLVRRNLYRALRKRLGLKGRVIKNWSKLAAAPAREKAAFQCSLMPPGLSAFPSAYVREVSQEEETALLDHFGHAAGKRDLPAVSGLSSAIAPEHINFFEHMFGFGQHVRGCIPCEAAVMAHRARKKGKGNYLLFDGAFSRSECGPLPVTA